MTTTPPLRLPVLLNKRRANRKPLKLVRLVGCKAGIIYTVVDLRVRAPTFHECGVIFRDHAQAGMIVPAGHAAADNLFTPASGSCIRRLDCEKIRPSPGVNAGSGSGLRI